MGIRLWAAGLSAGLVAAAAMAAFAGTDEDRSGGGVIATAPDRARSNGAIAAAELDPGLLHPDGRIVGAVVPVRIVSPKLQQALGGRSGQVTVDLDCRNGWYRSRDLVILPDPGAQGAAHPARLDGEWIASGSAAWLRQLAHEACRFDTPPPPVPILAMATLAGPPPLPTKPAPAPATDGGYYAQFVSSTSQAQVREMVQRLAPTVAPLIGDHALSIERVVVAGVVRYRGRVGAYRTLTEARQACRGLEARGLACVPARGGPG